MKIVASGGGTGGHTLPVLAVINSLNKLEQKSELVFIGSRFGMESRLIPKMGIKYYGISTGKFRRYHKSAILNLIDPTTIIKNATDFFGFIKGIFEARNVLMHEQPDVLFAKGGYVSLPVGLAARSLKIPIVIHESDIVMGLANRKLSKLANKVCVSFPTKNFPEIDPEKIIETGNPIRQDVLMGDGDGLKERLGFDKKRKTLLIMGGSQGSRFLNEIFLEIINEILVEYQVIWIAGDRDLPLVEYQISEIDEKLKPYIKAYGFVSSEIADIYAAADIFLGRSGSNVIFELAALGLPAIFVPLESSAGNHQFENARLLSRSGAAYILQESTLTPKKMKHQINNILSNDAELKNMSEQMRKWGNIGSADQLAQIIYQVGEESIEKNREAKK